jgi:N6-adenosine-specific RNA methylase IME4
MTPYRVLCADPPWKFGDSLPGKGRGAAKHYATMRVEEICAYPIPPVADDAVLFLWRVASMQMEALMVAEAWGFTPKTEVVWVKTTSPVRTAYLGPSRAQEVWQYFTLAFGMGRTVRASHEACLVATRGKFKPKEKNVRSVFFAPRGVHSEKPESFYTGVVEKLSDGPYVELFARRRRAGWASEGLEVGKL